VDQADEWIKLFKPCACQRLFIPVSIDNAFVTLYDLSYVSYQFGIAEKVQSMCWVCWVAVHFESEQADLRGHGHSLLASR
jgi:hypothetical protein